MREGRRGHPAWGRGRAAQGRLLTWHGLACGWGSPAQAALVLSKAVGPAGEQLAADRLRSTLHAVESESPRGSEEEEKSKKGFAGP